MKSPRPHVSLRATAVAPRLIGAADGAAAARRQCRWGLRGSLARLMKSPRPHVSLRATAVAPRLIGAARRQGGGSLARLIVSPRPHVSLSATTVVQRLIGTADGAAAAPWQTKLDYRGAAAYGVAAASCQPPYCDMIS